MKLMISINFHFSFWLSIVGGVLLFNNPNWFFDDPENIYGPLKNNLLIILIYLVISQLACWFLSYSRDWRFGPILMGSVFILVAGGLKFYASVNELPLLDWLPMAALYIGLSHCLYFWVNSKTIENYRKRP